MFIALVLGAKQCEALMVINVMGEAKSPHETIDASLAAGLGC